MRREPSRRKVLVLAVGLTGLSRVYAASSDFWNKKDPSEWSSQEIDQLTSKSPWAKEVTASVAVDGQGGGTGRHGGGMGGGMGGPIGGGMGGGGMGRHGGGMPSQNYRGTVRWETAKPVMEALKSQQFPEAFKDHYVISVSGFPVNTGGRRRQSQDDDSNSQQSTQETLDRLKGVTALQPKTKRDVQPGIVQQPPSASYGTVWFGFSKDMLALKPEDKEVTFVTQFGRMSLKAKFVLKDMLYKGELAV
jgi:hypothetical protein